jgi:hypothetical protein
MISKPTATGIRVCGSLLIALGGGFMCYDMWDAAIFMATVAIYAEVVILDRT